MQFAGQGKPPVGVVYITPMNRPDAALALAALYSLEGKREARAAAVVVSGGSLGAASFCDILLKFYFGSGQFLNSNRVLPIGLSADNDLPPNDRAIKAVLDKPYPHEIKLVSDTSEVRAMIRNALTGQVNGNAVIVLSADPTDLIRTLQLPGVPELIKAKVKILIVVDQPVEPLQKANWPTPIVTCPKDLGADLPYPAASIEKDFAWAPAPGHPVADFYRASTTGNTPGLDLAAILYAIHPELFQLTPSKQVTAPEPAQREKIIAAFTELASAKPVPRPGPRRRPSETPATPVPQQQKKTP